MKKYFLFLILFVFALGTKGNAQDTAPVEQKAGYIGSFNDNVIKVKKEDKSIIAKNIWEETNHTLRVISIYQNIDDSTYIVFTFNTKDNKCYKYALNDKQSDLFAKQESSIQEVNDFSKKFHFVDKPTVPAKKESVDESTLGLKMIPFTSADEEKYLGKMSEITTSKVGVNRIASAFKNNLGFMWHCVNGSGKFYRITCDKYFKIIKVIEIQESDIPRT